MKRHSFFSCIRIVRVFSIVICFSTISNVSKAFSKWEKVKIPNTTCGNGSDYFVFLRQGNIHKYTFELMGGGACWNEETCFGPLYSTPNFPIPFVPELGSLNSENPNQSPFSESSYVYFPYCTGDAHAGTNVISFKSGKKMHQVGRLNFEKSIKFLTETDKINLSNAEEFAMIGSSAGAIGALLHAPFIETYLPLNIKKTLVADAPGLHFGSKFWDKFPKEFHTDIENHLFQNFGIALNTNETIIAKHIPEICSKLSSWNVGFLQGSQDIVMANFFGNVSGLEHEKLVFGEEGLWAATKQSGDNCSSWIKKSAQHTFGVIMPSFFKVQNISALTFISNLVKNSDTSSYSD